MPRKLRPLDRDGGPAEFPPPYHEIVIHGSRRVEVSKTVRTSELADAVDEFEENDDFNAERFAVIEVVEGVRHVRTVGEIHGVCEKCGKILIDHAAFETGEFWQDGVEITLCNRCLSDDEGGDEESDEEFE